MATPAHEQLAKFATDAIESRDRAVVKARERIAELEAALRKWRDDYLQSEGNAGVAGYVCVPVHQIGALLDRK